MLEQIDAALTTLERYRPNLYRKFERRLFSFQHAVVMATTKIHLVEEVRKRR